MHDGQNSDKATGRCHGHVDILAENDEYHRKWYLKALGCEGYKTIPSRMLKLSSIPNLCYMAVAYLSLNAKL